MTPTVLVVDDSALVRKYLRLFLESEGMTVVTAKTGREALEHLAQWKPDVVTLDIQMPDIDGLTVLRELMATEPVPVVMISVLAGPRSRATVDALSMGAVDYVAKPDAAVSLRLDEVREEIVSKVWAAVGAQVRRAPRSAERLRAERSRAPARPEVMIERRPVDIVLIGASTGGPGILADIVGGLPSWFPPVVIAQHLPASFTPHLSARLGKAGEFASHEVRSPLLLSPGNAYVGRGGADVVVAKRADGLVAKSVPALSSHRWHPSVDRLVGSVAECVAPARVIGVLLSGMGDDGAKQMAALSAAGGRAIAESKQSAVVWGMPGELVAAGGADRVLDGDRIAEQLIAWVEPPSTTSAEEPALTEVGHGTRS